MNNIPDLLDWAETLLCNAQCPTHSTPDEWKNVVKLWRDEKHKNKTIVMTQERFNKLVYLVDWCINGCEHGVQTYDSWVIKCKELEATLTEFGGHPHGQWTTL